MGMVECVLNDTEAIIWVWAWTSFSDWGQRAGVGRGIQSVLKGFDGVAYRYIAWGTGASLDEHRVTFTHSRFWYICFPGSL